MRIPFDNLCLAAVVREVSPMVGARVQKVQQVNEHTLCLNLYAGESRWLLFSWDALHARSHFVSRPATKVPLGKLGEALRSRVVDGRLIAVRQIAWDRMLELDFGGEKGEHRLIVELMGKHSNVVLTEPGGRMVAAAKWVGASKSVRPILPGQSYRLPPVVEDAGEPRFGPFLRKWIEAAGAGGAARARRALLEGAIEPCLAPGVGAYPLPLDVLRLASVPIASYSQGAEEGFGHEVEVDQAEALRHRLLGRLERVVLAREVALRELSEARSALDRAGEHQRTGELLLTYAHTIPSGAAVADLFDYDGNARRIPLDPERTVIQNAQALFDRAKRTRANAGHVEERRRVLQEGLEELRAFFSQVRHAATLDQLADLESDALRRRWLHPLGVPNRPEDRPYEGHRVRELEGPGGVRVLYGENATANDYLTTRVARPNDWWLHVRGGVSAHVIIQTGNKPERVGPEALRYAAEVAVRNSPLKHSTMVPVDYTLKKHVRRPRGAAPGTALYTHEKTLHVDGEFSRTR
ncbi:MAG: NFACT family protein [Fimbriimonadaceae bacterium]|nr:NFACT family protein [Fimbriimonadaceae bacterium]